MKKLFKKLFCTLITLCLVFSINLVSSFAEEPIRYGDIDGNGYITCRDALMVLDHAVRKNDILDEAQKKYADVDRDGQISAQDAYLIFECVCDQYPGFGTDEIKTNGTLWIAADSIAAVGSHTTPGANYPNYGWGEVIGDYLTDGTVVNNMALGGRSSRSFTTEDNYNTMIQNMKAGDTMMIAFGHNDTLGGMLGTDPNGDSNTPGSYKYYIKHYYIDPAYKRGVQPILMTSVMRCYMDVNDPTQQYHYNFICAAKELAQEYKDKGFDLEFIDMFDMTWHQYMFLGKDAALLRYHAGTGSSRDTVHYNEDGARFAAQLILTSIKEAGWDFSKYIGTNVVEQREYLQNK